MDAAVRAMIMVVSRLAFLVRPLSLISLLAAFYGLSFCSATLHGQGTVSSIDPAGFRKPIDIGTIGVVNAGDDPNFAEPGYDDSHWQVINKFTLLRDYFHEGQQPIIWRRLHVRVNPADTGLALSIEPYGIDRAFEIYVNGRQLLNSGQVSPYVAYTRSARLLVPIPDDQTRTGSLLIAIRAYAPFATWKRVNAAFASKALTLGPETELRDRMLLRLIREKGAAAFIAVLGFGVGLVALLLLTSHTRQTEYFCIFALGMTGALVFAYNTWITLINVPALWNIFILCLNNLNCFVFLLLCQALTKNRFSRWVWIYVGAASLLASTVAVFFDLGRLPATYTDLANAPYYAIFAAIVPVLLLRQFRQGNREAGMLTAFLFFWSMSMYAIVLLSIFNLLSIFHGVSAFLTQSISGFAFGPLNASVFDIGTLLFWISLALIMVLRATHTSRVQAVLEGEMAAARAVQHVMLPEQIEAIPGFTVESAYLSAQEVGGDFFQVMEVDNGGLLVVVGDVAGKGLPAAMLVSVLVGSIRATAQFSHAPAQLLSSLNERLIGRTNAGFSTALAAHIEANGRVTIANAGHLSPYMDGHELELPGALPLGVLSGVQYEAVHFELLPGGRLTFYSDGVVEARNHRGELFGFDRTLKISTQPATVIAEAAKDFGQSDDITVVTIARDAVVEVAAA